MGDRSLTPAERALEYHQLHRAGGPGWWRSVVGVLVLVVVGLLVVPGVLQLCLLVGLVVSRHCDTLSDDFSRILDLNDPTPLGLAYLNVTLGALIPVTFLITWSLHR